MFRSSIRALFALAAVAVAAAAWAAYTGDGDQLLTEPDMANLPKEALTEYKLAEISYDHVDRDAGVSHLSEAAKRAPDFIPLQFCVASRARDRARFYSGVRSLEYYDIAEEALQRILKQSVLSQEEKRRADELIATIRREREEAPMKEKKMAELGFKTIVLPTAMERAKAAGTALTPEQISKLLGSQAPGTTTAAGTTAQPGSTAATGTTPGSPVIPGGDVPPSYGVPTEKPAVPTGPQVPGGMPYYGEPGMPVPPGGYYGPAGPAGPTGPI